MTRSSTQFVNLTAFAVVMALGVGALAQTTTTEVLPAVPTAIGLAYGVNVLDSMADRIRARGQFFESLAKAEKVWQESRIVEQQVDRERIASRMNRIKHYYEVKELEWQEREKERERTLTSKINLHDRRTLALKKLPIDAVVAARAKPLNEMLDRLSRDDLSIVFANHQDASPLSSLTLDSIRVVIGVGEARATANLLGDDGPEFTFDVPPVIKDNPKLNDLLDRLRASRGRMIEALAKGQDVDDGDHQSAMEALRVIGESVEDAPAGFESANDPRYRDYKSARAFLKEQLRQWALMGVGCKMPPAFKGKTFEDLARYLVDHQLRLAEAKPGREQGYRTLAVCLQKVLSASPTD